MRRAGLAAAIVVALSCTATSVSGRTAISAVPGIVDIKTNLPYAKEAAAGTGVVLTGRGEILTNNHVIRGATTIRVTALSNGRTYTATVVGYDVSSDIAVLQLQKASGLPTIALGRSATARVGSPVTGYGNAAGVGGPPRAAAGKIVALNRTITAFADDGGAEQLTGLIEVDAPLVPGDSGGPLVDGAGRTIGIDTAGSLLFRFAPADAGYGWAVPIDRALAIAAQIESGRSSTTVHVGPTAFLGVNFQPSTAFSGLTPGLTVVTVATGSPAAKAGLRAGDVVTSLDGRPIATPASLAALMFSQHPGAKLSVGWTDLTGGTHNATVVATSGPAQ